MNKLLLIFALFYLGAFMNAQDVVVPELPTVITNDNAVVGTVELRNDTILVFKNRGYYVIDNAKTIDPDFYDENKLNEAPFVSKIIQQNDSVVWLWGNDQLHQYSNKNITQYDLPFSHSIQDIVCDSKNNLWFATWGGGVYMYDGNLWTTYSKSNGLVDHRVTSLALGENDRIWLGYHMYGIGYIESGVIVNINEDSLDNPFDVSDIVLYGSNIIISAWDGLYKYSDGTISLVLDKSQLGDIAIGQNDSLWISTYQDGVYIVKLSDLEPIDPYYSENPPYDNVLSGSIYNILIDSYNNKWVGTLDGIQHKADDWRLYTSAGLSSNTIQNIKFHNSQTWICTYNGLCMLEQGQWYNFNDSNIKGHIVNDIAFNGNDIWVLTQDALLKCSFDATTKELAVQKNETLAITHKSLTAKDGKVYVATWGNGISYQTSTGWETITESNGLASNSVYTIAFQNDVMWVVTLKGITRVVNDVITSYMTKTDIPVDYVHDMTIDSNGTPYFISPQGILKYVDSSFLFYPHDSGFPGNRHIQADSNGKILVGGSTGFYIYDSLNDDLIKASNSWEFDNVRSISVDEEEKIWVGLSQGVRTNADILENIPTKILPNQFEPTQVILFPNPTKGDLLINAENEIDKYEIYSSSGHCIKVGKGIKNRIEFSSFTSGIYIVKLHVGQQIITKKIIKE